jgi:hypothetical protein
VDFTASAQPHWLVAVLIDEFFKNLTFWHSYERRHHLPEACQMLWIGFGRLVLSHCPIIKQRNSANIEKRESNPSIRIDCSLP